MPSVEVSPAEPKGSAGSPVWWVRLASALPWGVLYLIADVLAWFSWRVFKYRPHVVRENLRIAFPELDEAALNDLMRRFYKGYADVLVEIVKSTRLSADEVRERVAVRGFERARQYLADGTPVLLVGAHQANWEWTLLGLAVQLGYPLDASYKPLVDEWADREMFRLRSRFGTHLVPAQDVLADLIKRGRLPRAIALLADQEPKTSERKHWTRFLNRDSAFYMGPEELARATRFPVFFVGMRRLSRGRYELELRELAGPGEKLPSGELTERYARIVEETVRAAPADWPWSHKRWKLKKPLYSGKG